jgi:hypothetical protein
MTEDRARQVANVVMAAAAVGAAVFVLRSPKLRRMAWQLARQYAAGPLAAWGATTVRDAWNESASADGDRRRAMADRSADESQARMSP